MVEIIQATTESHIEDVIALCTEYVTWMLEALKQTYPDVDTDSFLQAHSYENLKARFPGEYVPPAGRLLLALNNGKVCGCIALAKWSESICEMQTLFVRPECRGMGIGKQLVTDVIGMATDIGYHTMRLDTLAFMTGAQDLYKSLGFYAIEPYRDGGAGAIQQYIRFYELDLQTTIT